MAKGQREPRTDIDWILRDRKVIDGLDHLGIELVSVNLYQAMLPGITNVTERARYYSFYPWTVHSMPRTAPSCARRRRGETGSARSTSPMLSLAWRTNRNSATILAAL